MSPCSRQPDIFLRVRGTGYAYNTTMYAGSTRADSITIRASWTRGLAIHPVAAGMSLIALLFSLSAHMTARLLAALAAFLASIITLIAFATDIALFAYVKEKASKLDGTTTTTDTAPGTLSAPLHSLCSVSQKDGHSHARFAQRSG